VQTSIREVTGAFSLLKAVIRAPKISSMALLQDRQRCRCRLFVASLELDLSEPFAAGFPTCVVVVVVVSRYCIAASASTIP
jgi:hypothetical protein